MDINELDSFIGTNEGQTWLTRHKQPLLDKRDELLKELKAVNGRLAEATQRVADSEKLLSEERDAIKKAVVDAPLAAMLEKIGAAPGVVPGLIAELKEVGDIQVQANGLDRSAKVVLKNVDGESETLDLGDFVDRWNTMPDGKRKLASPFGNVGAPKTGMTQPAFTRDNLDKMTSEQILANLPTLTRK